MISNFLWTKDVSKYQIMYPTFYLICTHEKRFGTQKKRNISIQSARIISILLELYATREHD